MRRIAFKAIGINGESLGTRVLSIGSGTGNAFAEEYKKSKTHSLISAVKATKN